MYLFIYFYIYIYIYVYLYIYSAFWHDAGRVTHCNILQHTATHQAEAQARICTVQTELTNCNTMQHTATHCNTLQHTATYCNTLQHTATHCNTLQHTATQQAESRTRIGAAQTELTSVLRAVEDAEKRLEDKQNEREKLVEANKTQLLNIEAQIQMQVHVYMDVYYIGDTQNEREKFLKVSRSQLLNTDTQIQMPVYVYIHVNVYLCRG